MSRRAIAAFLFLSAVACTHRGGMPLDLGRELTIRVTSVPTEAVAGGSIQVGFAIRNNSDRELHLCSPGGVTVHLVSDSPRNIWPIIVHGYTTDTDCSGPFQLSPGGEKVFIERGRIRKDFSNSTPRLIGVISIDCARRYECKETTLRIEQAITVVPSGG